MRLVERNSYRNLRHAMPGRFESGHLCDCFRPGELYAPSSVSDVSEHICSVFPVDGPHPVNLRSFITHTGGATAVEFALTAPVFFAIVFGLIDAGLMLWMQLGLQHATRSEEHTSELQSHSDLVCRLLLEKKKKKNTEKHKNKKKEHKRKRDT